MECIFLYIDIERTLAALDHVIGYYSVAQEVEVTVRSGPFVAGLDEFLAAMQRLQNALTYFEKNNPQSVELENVVSVFLLNLVSIMICIDR